MGSSAKGPGYFHGDWATIIRSLLAFHARVSVESRFDGRISDVWGRKWTGWIFYFWFDPKTFTRQAYMERQQRLLNDILN